MIVRVSVVGTGGIAGRHLSNLSRMEDVQIVSVCDIDAAKVQRVAEELRCRAFTDCEAMLAETKPDLLLVCTPPGYRRRPVEAAAALGIACFIEKPPATDVDEAERICRIIEESGIIAGVGFMYRYAGAVQKAKELISGLPVPIVRSLFVCGVALNPNWPRWFFNKSISGGPLLDQAIHILDSSRYIVSEFAGDVERIQCFGSNVTLPKGDDFTIEDSHVLNLRYRKGTIQSHTHSWSIAPTRVEIDLLSKDYSLKVHLNPEPERHRSRLTGHVNNVPVEWDFVDEDFYVTEMNAFLQAVREKNSSLIRSPYRDAAQTLRLVLAANRSVESGEVISL